MNRAVSFYPLRRALLGQRAARTNVMRRNTMEILYNFFGVNQEGEFSGLRAGGVFSGGEGPQNGRFMLFVTHIFHVFCEFFLNVPWKNDGFCFIC